MASKRTKEPEELVEVNNDYGFLTEYQEADASMDALSQYRIVPRCKVIQAMSDSSLKDQFGEGSAIVSPGGMLIAEKGDPFHFVPLFFFTEFIKWRDRKDSSGNAIMERTFDQGSELAAYARDPERRHEKDGKFVHRYCEHLNFVGTVYNGKDEPEPIILGFARGDFGKGKQWASAIQMRRAGGRPVPLWAQVWRFHTVLNQGTEGDWYQLRFDSPEQPVINQEHVETMRELHEMLKKDFESNRLVADHSESDEEEGETSSKY